SMVREHGQHSGEGRLTQARATAQTPAGAVVVEATERGVARVRFLDDAAERVESDAAAPAQAKAIAREAAEQLRAYAEGELDALRAPLDLRGGAFALRVWRQLRCVKAGKTISYGELAQRVGSPAAARAVGRAMATNPTPLFVPCHRVVRGDGAMGQFTGGAWRKAALLQHEGAAVVADEPATTALGTA
ncbi:MAG: methylated-DNA--[protein]-cysteine S-methyltransferase, partial [Planctomycetota bacterium]